MKVIINDGWGGFHVPDEVRKELQCDSYDDTMAIRTNPYFISWVLVHNDDTALAVYEIPDDATDCMITENDGWDTLYYVKDGKIWAATEFSY